MVPRGIGHVTQRYRAWYPEVKGMVLRGIEHGTQRYRAWYSEV